MSTLEIYKAAARELSALQRCRVMFKPGQVVVATSGYSWLLTKGKQYTVVRYEPECVTPTFTWPAYVTVVGGNGKKVTGHEYRFKPVNL